MFKKRNLKAAGQSKRRGDFENVLEDNSISSFAAEPAPKKSKIDQGPPKDIDYTKPRVNEKIHEKEKYPEEAESENQSHDVTETNPRVVGPKAAPKNVRVTTLTDFQPDACFMARFKKDKKRKCFICKKDTGGAVQPVKDIPEIGAN
ncbi:hypothetical protein OXX69_007219 [Metschnikowia pulcherrima]